MTVTTGQCWQWADRLESLGLRVQEYVHQMLTAGEPDLATPVADEGGDTIYQIDRRVEHLIELTIGAWPDDCLPLMLVAEGLGHDGHRRFGPTDGTIRFRMLLDPIDGTRGLMYDKRSAWFLAAVAEDRGAATSLREAFAAVMVELPISKQNRCDTYAAVRGQPVRSRRVSVGGAESEARVAAPSRSQTLADGFGQVTSFFQGTCQLAAELSEAIADRIVPNGTTARDAILNDQYISTGGQMVELACGHDRFCCDLRPLFHEILRRRGRLTFPELVCHPYDIAGLLVAQQAGVLITDGFGRELDAPFSVHRPVHWCGYANTELRDGIAPVIQQWLRSQGIEPPC